MNFKFERSREWYAEFYRWMAEIEGDCDISAGPPLFSPREVPTVDQPAKPKRTRKPAARATPRKRRSTTPAKSQG